MPLFRRRKLHEQLARAGGLWQELEPEPIDPGPHWGATGIHGVPRLKRWDAVAAAEAPGVAGNEARFVVLPDGSLILDDDAPEGSLAPLADSLDQLVDPPYRAEAVRQDGDMWAVAARRIRVVELPDAPGDELQLTVSDEGKRLVVDGVREFGTVPELERTASAQFPAYVAEASRLDGDLFELRLTPL